MTVFGSDELDSFARNVRRFVDDRYDFATYRRLVASCSGFGEAVWHEMAELGWLALPIGVGHGGLGGGATETAIIMDAIGHGLLLEPYLASVVLAGGLVERAGSADQKEALLPLIGTGKDIYAFAHEDRDSLHPVDAVRIGDAVRLSGAKVLVLHGDIAARLVVSARIDSGQGLFLVDADAAGVDRTPFILIDGRRAADIRLDNVAAERLGTADAAMHVATTLDHAVAALCAEAVGAMTALNAMTLAYAKTREQFGVTIGSFQVIQHRLVDMMVAETETRSIARAAAQAIDVGHPHASMIVSAAKIRVNRAARFIGESAVQLHGGIGMTAELPVGHYFKRLLSIGSLLGDCEAHLDRLAACA